MTDVSAPVTAGDAFPGEQDADPLLIAIPLFGPWLFTGFLLVIVLFGQHTTEPWAIAASTAVLLAPFVGLVLAKWRWRGHGGWSTVASPLMLTLAIGLTAFPVTAMFGLKTIGTRPGVAGAVDTRLWVFGDVKPNEIQEPLILATLLMAALATLGWLARRRRSGSWLAVLWLVAALTGLVWLPMMGFTVMGMGLASHSPASPDARLIWGIPFVAHAVTPVLALLAGATVSNRAWIEDPPHLGNRAADPLGQASD